MRVEQYVEQHSQATFSHSVCPECATRYFGPDMIPDGAAGDNPPPGENIVPARSALTIQPPPAQESV
jgi:hypothetical protein